jgi:hypothetical protein
LRPRLYVEVEPASSPGKDEPSARSEDLAAVRGHAFIPPSIHAGGLRYHGIAPLVSAGVQQGLLAPRAQQQLECYEAAVLFARTGDPASTRGRAIDRICGIMSGSR